MGNQDGVVTNCSPRCIVFYGEHSGGDINGQRTQRERMVFIWRQFF